MLKCFALPIRDGTSCLHLSFAESELNEDVAVVEALLESKSRLTCS